jgi:hypothetical protein
MESVDLVTSGMHCGSCSMLIEMDAIGIGGAAT